MPLGRSGRLAVILLILSSTGSWAQSQKAQDNAISPGGVRITARNPLQGNWICKGSACTCKPLACAAASRVSYGTVPTPARRPDPQALERLAKVDIPKGILAANAAQGILSDGKVKIEMLTSRVASHLGYPSVLSEAKVVMEKGTIFSTSASVFVGPVLLTVKSLSPDRAVAMKSLNEFIRVMSVQEGPSISPKVRPVRPTPSSPVLPAPSSPAPMVKT